jgi:hypothetical protein
MLGQVRFIGIAQDGFCNTYDYAHCRACNASSGRGIRRVFQILGFAYAPNCCASRSSVHDRGVFALTNIPSGELLVEYKGEVKSWRVASERYQRNSAADGHKFIFGWMTHTSLTVHEAEAQPLLRASAFLVALCRGLSLFAAT